MPRIDERAHDRIGEGKHEDTHHHDEKEKGRAAAVMYAGTAAHVLHRQGESPLETGDGLMFGAVVHKHAANFLHCRYCRHCRRFH